MQNIRRPTASTVSQRRSDWKLLGCLLVAGGVLMSLPVRAASPPRSAPAAVSAATRARDLAMHVGNGFTLAAVGDCITARPVRTAGDAGLASLGAILRHADVAFGNFEGSAFDLRRFKGAPQAENGGQWLLGGPGVPASLAAFGFTLMSRANNHATDWGVAGMRATDRLLDRAGIVHAGTGASLSAARAPRYLETAGGRVALVAAATSFTPMSRAMDALGEAPARPGVDALRTTRWEIVTPTMMQALRRIRAAQPPASLPRRTDKPGELTLFGVHYRTGPAVGVSYVMNALDERGLLASIREGKENADFLVASVHAHEPGNWSDTPPDFMPALAHAAIDAGADAFLVHGPHRLRGIEIYKGRPIFYSLGNFLFEVEQQEPVARDMYEQMGLNPATTTDVELNEKFRNRIFNAPIWYQSVIAVCVFGEHALRTIRLYPIELGVHARPADRGIPHPASPAEARQILERLARLSAPYGTTITIKGGVGMIQVAPPATTPHR